jgi:hypothetical protein
VKALTAMTVVILGVTGCTGIASLNEQDEAADPTKPVDEARQTQLGMVCDARLTLTGSFTQAAPQPEDVFGCWPVGTWTFTAKVGESNCTTNPTLESAYTFRVTRSPETESDLYTYDNDPNNADVRVKVTSGGSGLCEGGLTYFRDGGKVVVNLKPNLHADGHLDGQGEYEEYGQDQR